MQLDDNGGGTSGGGVETVLPGDANLDGQVDINDLTIVLAHYGQTSGSSAGVAAVPEPGVLALLAAGLASLLAYAWRKRK